MHLFNKDRFLLQVDMNRSMILHSLNAMVGIQVFVQSDLEDGCTSLPKYSQNYSDDTSV